MQGLTRRYAGVLLGSAFLLGAHGSCQSNSGNGSPLQVSYGRNGLQKLSYNGVVLADLDSYASDNFYIGHMKATDLAGNVLQGGQNGWGEVNNGKRWDAASQTWTYSFNWGTIAVQYQQHGTNLDVVTTISNNGNSGLIFDGAAVFPMVLHFPQLPNGFGQPNYPQMAFNTTGPSVTTADWGGGEVVAVAPDASKPLYSGFWPAQSSGGVTYAPEISGTSPDGLATFQPHNDRPVYPGQTDQYTVSLRFAASGTSTQQLAADAYASWGSNFPAVLNWTDRRAIGTVFLASSPQSGDITQPGGFPTNPRRYFNSGSVDTTTASGLVAFQQQILSKASEIVANSQHLNAQGVITWDIEGEQYPQSTSYVCEPDAIAQVAPEMESTVNVPGSPFRGKKLDDAYFATIHNAGLRVGLCLRPQHFTQLPNGTASQVYLPQTAIAAELLRKAKYAHDRWGATLFYVDSTVDSSGGVLPAAIFQQLQAALPDSLFIPEETTPLHYAYTAPFKSFIDLSAVGTDPSTLFFYPHAFSAILINDADAGRLAAATPQLIQQVRQGDILMAHVDYWQDNDPTIVAIYQAAGVIAAPTPVVTVPTTPDPVATTPDPTPVAVPTPVVTVPTLPDPVVPTPTPITTPVVTVPTTPDPVVTTPTVVVTPVSTPTSSLIAIASPGAGQSVTGAIVVQGVVNDALDAAGSHLIVDGYDLYNTRLTGGPYVYALDTTTLPNGQHTLQLWGHDINNNTILSATVSVSVSN